MVRTIGFDLDMTLINSRPQILEAFQFVALHLQTKIDLDAVEARLGVKLEDELRYWFDEPMVPEATAIYRQAYVQLARNSTLLPGALEAIAHVHASGDRVAIVTAKHQISAEPCLAATGLHPDTLHAFVHGDEKTEVLKSIGASVYVGDTPDDMRAAQNAGVVGIGVTTGVFGVETLYSAGAAVVLGSLDEFPGAFASIRSRDLAGDSNQPDSQETRGFQSKREVISDFHRS